MEGVDWVMAFTDIAIQREHERNLLADALGRVLVASGVTDQPLTGPELLLLANDLIEHLQTQTRLDLPAMQADVGHWIDEQFLPGDNLERRGLVLGAESGEVQQAIVKAPGTKIWRVEEVKERWMTEVEKEAGDAFIALLGVAHRAGFDLSEALEVRWAEVRLRVYKGTGT